MNHKRKECVAMLLAGGQGSRLYALTQSTAKPAVTFGGKYRIIDFPLSNCINSGIDTVGVLTQYQPLELNDYIGNGLPWDLDRTYGGVKILPPYQGQKKADWYKGTANAIYQNLNFIQQYDPEYVVILSGDHIYRMDYSEMLRYHKKKNADCTIAVLEVPLKEASRFGILTTHDDGQIFKFTEKPKEPDSTKASMGIYIFNKKKLFDYLIADEADETSSNDFGKNIIPNMLKNGERMFAYPFEGYWKDVGTLDSLWEANMDLIGSNPAFSMNEETRGKIYSRSSVSPPQFVGDEGVAKDSIITEGCKIYGTVINSVLSHGVTVEVGATVKDSVIMANTYIGKDATVDFAILDENITVEEGAKVGAPKESAKGLAVIGKNVTVAKGKTVADGEMISE
ncbi:MAG: glucose-1-phosphate adenylyltransferase [Clostridia bacterium]|nr:glucose-1-phosphate adenylyltransferase [Clostridia bacterium]MBQ6614364.1 glucose-1-phosphate adenylyltransferase [Clostridia bacterium]